MELAVKNRNVTHYLLIKWTEQVIYTAFEYQAINCNIYQLIVHLNIIIVSLYIDVHVFVTV